MYVHMEFASGYTTIIFKEKKQQQKDKKKRNKKNQIWISLIDCEYNFSNFLLVNI